MLADSEAKKRPAPLLGPLNLVTLGIGAIIGTGIFVLTGTVAGTAAGRPSSSRSSSPPSPRPLPAFVTPNSPA